MNRTFTKVALAAATAMTLSLAAPISAHADESGSATFAPQAQAPSAATPSTVTSGSVRLTSHGYLTADRYVYSSTRASVNVTPGWNWYVSADVYVNGVLRASGQGIASNARPSAAVRWAKSAGFGTAQLRNVKAEAYGPNGEITTTALPNSNVIRVLRTINPRAYLKIVKRGKKATAKAGGFRVYQPNGSQLRAAKKVKLQRKVKGKWRNYKNIKLNAKGTGKIKFSQKKKYYYRIYVPSTRTVQGGATKSFKI